MTEVFGHDEVVFIGQRVVVVSPRGEKVLVGLNEESCRESAAGEQEGDGALDSVVCSLAKNFFG